MQSQVKLISPCQIQLFESFKQYIKT